MNIFGIEFPEVALTSEDKSRLDELDFYQQYPHLIDRSASSSVPPLANFKIVECPNPGISSPFDERFYVTDSEAGEYEFSRNFIDRMRTKQRLVLDNGGIKYYAALCGAAVSIEFPAIATVNSAQILEAFGVESDPMTIRDENGFWEISTYQHLRSRKVLRLDFSISRNGEISDVKSVESEGLTSKPALTFR